MVYHSDVSHTLHHGDCRAVLASLPDASVDAVISDPPYPEIDRPYGKLTESEWAELMHDVIRETRRVLKPHGSAVFVLQPNSERIGRMRPWLFEFQAWVCREWNMIQDSWWLNTSPIPEANAIQGQLMRPALKACVWVGEPDCYRNQRRVLWTETQAAAYERLGRRSFLGRDNMPSGHGTNRGTMADKALERGGVTPYNVLPLSNANARTSGGAAGHGAATPYALCDWWTRFIVKPGGTVLDPFCGSGTVGMAALRRGHRFIGIEQHAQYCEMSKERLACAQAQSMAETEF